MKNIIQIQIFAITITSLFILSAFASSKPGKYLNYSDFRKILIFKKQLIPISDNTSLITLKMPGDNYSKLYELNHKTKKAKLKFDAGKSIKRFQRDSSYKNYYFSMDDSGNELYKIYSYDPTNNSIKMIFGHPYSSARIVDYSNDGKRIYVISNHENSRSFNLYRLNLNNQKKDKLTDGKINITGTAINKDETFAALSETIGNNKSNIYILNLKTGQIKLLLTKDKTNYFPSFFDPEKPYLYINTNENFDRTGCAKINFKKGNKIEWVFKDSGIDNFCYYNKLEDFSILTQEYDGRRNLTLYKGVFKRNYRLPFPDKTIISRLVKFPQSSKIAFIIGKSDYPSEYYTFDLNKGDKQKPFQISDLSNIKIESEQFSQSFDIYYSSTDNEKIHGIYNAKSNWLKSNKKYPLIVWLHGGPDSQRMHSFHPFIQFAAQHGFAVFSPNFRGSLGYGKRFETLNDRDWAGKDLEDIITGVNKISEKGFIDKNRIFVAGASFGGFLSLSAAIRFPDTFKGIAAILPITDLFTFMKYLPRDPGRIHEFLNEIGHPVTDKQFYMERSPYYNAEKIKTPLIVFQAENDMRISKSETDIFINRLKTNKIPVKYTILKNDGHRLSKDESWQTIFDQTISFFNSLNSDSK